MVRRITAEDLDRMEAALLRVLWEHLRPDQDLQEFMHETNVLYAESERLRLLREEFAP